MADDIIYFYNERGYQQPNRIGAWGGTTKTPLSGADLPQGKANQFDGTQWVAADPDPGQQVHVV